jgi:hypothetical protein
VEVRLIETDLIVANVSEAKVGGTLFVNSDLSRVIGLETLDHRGPSHISIDTFILSQGKIPEIFLRGCGLSDADIEYAKLSNPDLGMEERNKILQNLQDLRAAQVSQIYPLFVSYSHSDSVFVDKLERVFNEKGIRFWRDNHEIKAGHMEKQLDPALRQHPKVLLVLSEHSIQGDWVEQEVNEASKLEKELGRHVLCPVALDARWKNGRLPKSIMEQIVEYNILDFSAWKDNNKFDVLLGQLIDALGLFDRGAKRDRYV